MTMTTMVVRLDMYSVVYGVFLGVLLLLNRRQCAFVWPFYVAILVVLLIAQYLSCVGAPPALCWGNFYIFVDYIYILNINIAILSLKKKFIKKNINVTKFFFCFAQSIHGVITSTETSKSFSTFQITTILLVLTSWFVSIFNYSHLQITL